MYMSLSKFIDIGRRVFGENDATLIAKMKLSGFGFEEDKYVTTIYHPQNKSYNFQCERQPDKDLKVKTMYTFTYNVVSFLIYGGEDGVYPHVSLTEMNILRGSMNDLLYQINESLLNLSNERLIFRHNGVSYYVGRNTIKYDAVDVIIKGIRDEDNEVVFLLPVEGRTTEYLGCSFDNGILNLRLSNKDDKEDLVLATVEVNLYDNYDVVIRESLLPL